MSARSGAAGGETLALALLFLPRTFPALLPAVALLAIFRSPVIPLADSTIAGMASRHALNYGNMRLWGSFSYALVAILGGVAWQRTGYRPMFLAAAALAVPVAYLAMTLEPPTAVERHQRAPLHTVARDPLLVTLLAATFLIGSAIAMDTTFSGIYMVHLGGSNLFVGLLFGLSAMCELPAMRYSGHLAARLGGMGALLVSYALFGVAYLGYALAPGPGVLLLFTVFRGLGYGLFYVSTVRLINERAPAEWSATVQGAMNAVGLGLAPLLAAPLSGRLFDALGPEAVFVTASAVVGAAVLVLGSTIGLRSARAVREVSQPEPAMRAGSK